MTSTHTKATQELLRLKNEVGTWRGVGILIADKVGGSANGWMVIANAVARGKRRPNHRLLVALGLRKRRRRFSCDVPTWMDEEDEAKFRAIMRGSADRAESLVLLDGIDKTADSS